jgi:hypothetical protein
MGRQKGAVSRPFAALSLFIFPLDMQIHRAADNHQTKHDG